MISHGHWTARALDENFERVAKWNRVAKLVVSSNPNSVELNLGYCP